MKKIVSRNGILSMRLLKKPEAQPQKVA